MSDDTSQSASQDPTQNPTQEPTQEPTQDPTQDAAKDPADWTTGDEPMTGPQRSYLGTLAREAGEEVPDDLTKAQASEMIDRLQGKTGRGA